MCCLLHRMYDPFILCLFQRVSIHASPTCPLTINNRTHDRALHNLLIECQGLLLPAANPVCTALSVHCIRIWFFVSELLALCKPCQRFLIEMSPWSLSPLQCGRILCLETSGNVLYIGHSRLVLCIVCTTGRAVVPPGCYKIELTCLYSIREDFCVST